MDEGIKVMLRSCGSVPKNCSEQGSPSSQAIESHSRSDEMMFNLKASCCPVTVMMQAMILMDVVE